MHDESDCNIIIAFRTRAKIMDFLPLHARCKTVKSQSVTPPPPPSNSLTVHIKQFPDRKSGT
jgi:hypothetical protein